MRTILVHGASTAAGWYDMEHAGWANRLRLDALKVNYSNPQEAVVVQNPSIPGNTLLGIMKDIDGVDRYQRLGRVTTILAIGLNESKIVKGRTRPLVSVTKFRDALQNYGDYTEARGVDTVYLGTEMLMDDTVVTENGNTFESDLTDEYDYLIREAASERGAPYVSQAELFGELGPENAIGADGFHPGALGHAAIHAAIVTALGSYEPLGR